MCVYTTQPAASIPPSRFSIGRTFLFVFMCLESTIWLMAVSFSHLTCLPALYMRSCRFAHNYRLIISSSVDSGRYASSLFHMYSVWCDAVQYAVFLLCCPYSLLLFLCIIVVGFDIFGSLSKWMHHDCWTMFKSSFVIDLLVCTWNQGTILFILPFFPFFNQVNY